MLNFTGPSEPGQRRTPGLRAPEHGRGGDPANELASSNAPLPTMVPLTPSERRGLEVYVSEGCAACHTQQVRNIEMDKVWGDRPKHPQ